MSYTDNFIQEAIESCKIYSDYCKRNDKSQIITKVSHITKGDTPRSFVLHFENRSSFHSFDSEAICIRLNEDDILPEDYYDDITRHYIKHDFFSFLTYLHKEQQLIISVKNDKLLSLFRDFLPNNPDRICFVSDMTFLIDKVKDWYEYHKDKIFLPLLSSGIPFDMLDQALLDSLSESQTDAVKNALESPVSYIWGPPGTGKTWTLAHTVLALVRNGKKVLIVAPTNNAIDNSLRTILRVMEAKGEPTENVTRWGLPTISFEQEFSYVCDNSAISKMIKSYKARIDECKRILETYQEYDTFSSQVDSFRKYKQLYVEQIESIDLVKSELSAQELICSEFLEHLREAKCLAKEARMALDKHKQKSMAPKHILKIRVSKDYRDKYNRDLHFLQSKFDDKNKAVDGIHTDYAQAVDKRKSIEQHIASLTAQANNYLRQIETISKKLFGSFVSLAVSEAEILQREEEYRKVKSREQIESDIKYYQFQLEDIDKLVEQQKSAKKIFACTIDYLYAHYDYLFDNSDPMNPPLRIDHVFIDEAALLPMIKAGIAFSMDTPVTMCGDHKQLPPVCEMDDKDIERCENNPVYMWAQSSLYFTDIFYHNSNELLLTYTSAGDILNTDLSVSFLKHTFRFGDNLAKILDTYIYHNGFTGTSETTKITIIDAPHITPSVRSRTSMDEVFALKKYLLNHPVDDFVIVTPYRYQRDLLRKELKKIVSSSNIQTIHASQGLEWSTVILSVVDTSRPWFCNSGIPIGRNVLNTAISRSIDELIIVCDYNYWVAHPKQLIGSLAINNTHIETE